MMEQNIFKMKWRIYIKWIDAVKPSKCKTYDQLWCTVQYDETGRTMNDPFDEAVETDGNAGLHNCGLHNYHTDNIL